VNYNQFSLIFLRVRQSNESVVKGWLEVRELFYYLQMLQLKQI